MNQWQVGNVKITRVIEMEIAGGTKFILPQATRDKVREINWLAPHFADKEGNLIMTCFKNVDLFISQFALLMKRLSSKPPSLCKAEVNPHRRPHLHPGGPPTYPPGSLAPGPFADFWRLPQAQ